MIRRSLSACLSAAALVGSLGMAARAAAKPPDLPMNETITVAPTATLYEALPNAVPTPTLYQLRPTARRTLVGSLLCGIHPVLGWLPMEKALDAPHDHPQRVAGDDVLGDIPIPHHERKFAFGTGPNGCAVIEFGVTEEGDWLKWLITHWTAQHQVPAPERNEGYLHAVAPDNSVVLLPIEIATEECEAPGALVGEPLPMPKEESTTDGITCPYLRQQRMDRHASQLADPEIGRDVLANLERLQESDNLIELAEKLIREGNILEAMECCALVGELCPGSPCADRAADMLLDLGLGLRQPAVTTEEAAEEHAHIKLMLRVYAVADLLEQKLLPEIAGMPARKSESNEQRLMDVISNIISPRSWSSVGGIGTIDYHPMTKALVINQTAEVHEQIDDLLAALRRLYDNERDQKESRPEKKADGSTTEPGVEQQVNGLMKACRLLVNEGLHEHAAELARQAYALDPERVMADPLIYKMHLLADTPAKQPFGSTHPAGASEEAEEPATCPYCPSGGKPIQGILPKKKECKSGPTTLLVPPLPPVDYEVVPALDRVLTESAKSVPSSGAEEASDSEGPSSLPDLIESIMGDSGRGTIGLGVSAEGCLDLSGEWTYGGNVYHVRYNRGCLAIWKTSDAARSKP